LVAANSSDWLPHALDLNVAQNISI